MVLGRCDRRGTRSGSVVGVEATSGLSTEQACIDDTRGNLYRRDHRWAVMSWQFVMIRGMIYILINFQTDMNNFARVILVFAAIFTVLGGIGFLSGAAVASSDLEEYAIFEGTQGSFTVDDDHLGLEVYAVGEANCNSFDVTIRDSSGSTEDDIWGDYFEKDCGGGVEYDGYTYIGYFSMLFDAGAYTISSNNPILLLDTGDELVDAIGGGLLALCSLPLLICGFIGLLAGGILGAVMKDKQNIVIASGGQLGQVVPMQTMVAPMHPAQQYPPQTMQYQQPPNQGQPPQF